MVGRHGEKVGAPLIGNSIAYFVVVLILVRNGWLDARDTGEAIAMGGALVTWLLLQVGTGLGFIADLIRKRFTGKKQGEGLESPAEPEE